MKVLPTPYLSKVIISNGIWRLNCAWKHMTHDKRGIMNLLEWIPGLYPNAPRRNVLVILFHLLAVLLGISALDALGIV